MDTVKYISLKQRQRRETKQKIREGQDIRNSRLDNQQTVGLGHGYTPDMSETMRKVNEFDYQSTEAEIHMRRKFSGQWIDKPPSKPTK